MPQRKAKRIKFALSENDTFLSVRLAIDGRSIFDARLSDAPPVKVRHGKARADELLDYATYFARRSPGTWRDPAAWLHDYIGSCEQKIIDQVIAIRKSLRKIEGNVRNANVAKNVRSRAKTDA